MLNRRFETDESEFETNFKANNSNKESKFQQF